MIYNELDWSLKEQFFFYQTDTLDYTIININFVLQTSVIV